MHRLIDVPPILFTRAQWIVDHSKRLSNLWKIHAIDDDNCSGLFADNWSVHCSFDSIRITDCVFCTGWAVLVRTRHMDKYRAWLNIILPVCWIISTCDAICPTESGSFCRAFLVFGSIFLCGIRCAKMCACSNLLVTKRTQFDMHTQMKFIQVNAVQFQQKWQHFRAPMYNGVLFMRIAHANGHHFRASIYLALALAAYASDGYSVFCLPISRSCAIHHDAYVQLAQVTAAGEKPDLESWIGKRVWSISMATNESMDFRLSNEKLILCSCVGCVVGKIGRKQAMHWLDLFGKCQISRSM